jgi:hypothetical protein
MPLSNEFIYSLLNFNFLETTSHILFSDVSDNLKKSLLNIVLSILEGISFSDNQLNNDFLSKFSSLIPQLNNFENSDNQDLRLISSKLLKLLMSLLSSSFPSIPSSPSHSSTFTPFYLMQSADLPHSLEEGSFFLIILLP